MDNTAIIEKLLCYIKIINASMSNEKYVKSY